MGADDESARGGGRPVVVWLAGACLVLVAGAHAARIPSFSAAFKFPDTPVDLGSTRYARFWSFLMRARRAVPEGASYTVIAADSEDEMYLFMLSFGVFERHEALASSYFGVSTPQEGSRARFLLAFDRAPSSSADWRLVAQIGQGAVFERKQPN